MLFVVVFIMFVSASAADVIATPTWEGFFLFLSLHACHILESCTSYVFVLQKGIISLRHLHLMKRRLSVGKQSYDRLSSMFPMCIMIDFLIASTPFFPGREEGETLLLNPYVQLIKSVSICIEADQDSMIHDLIAGT